MAGSRFIEGLLESSRLINQMSATKDKSYLHFVLCSKNGCCQILCKNALTISRSGRSIKNMKSTLSAMTHYLCIVSALAVTIMKQNARIKTESHHLTKIATRQLKAEARCCEAEPLSGGLRGRPARRPSCWASAAGCPAAREALGCSVKFSGFDREGNHFFNLFTYPIYITYLREGS